MPPDFNTAMSTIDSLVVIKINILEFVLYGICKKQRHIINWVSLANLHRIAIISILLYL